MCNENLVSSTYLLKQPTTLFPYPHTTSYNLIPLPPHKKAVGCKWIFQIKENYNGTLNKYKAMWVAKGYHQV